MEKFQIELVVELIDQEIEYSQNNLNRHKHQASKDKEWQLKYGEHIEWLEGRIKNLKVIRNLMIYGE